MAFSLPIPLPRPTEHLHEVSWLLWFVELCHAAKYAAVYLL